MLKRVLKLRYSRCLIHTWSAHTETAFIRFGPITHPHITLKETALTWLNKLLIEEDSCANNCYSTPCVKAENIWIVFWEIYKWNHVWNQVYIATNALWHSSTWIIVKPCIICVKYLQKVKCSSGCLQKTVLSCHTHRCFASQVFAQRQAVSVGELLIIHTGAFSFGFHSACERLFVSY